MLGQILELYSRMGESLEENGLNEAVLPIAKASLALDLYEKTNILVIGGDVYTKGLSGSFEPYYADWFYEGEDVRESILQAKRYLSQFVDKELFVSFILK